MTLSGRHDSPEPAATTAPSVPARVGLEQWCPGGLADAVLANAPWGVTVQDATGTLIAANAAAAALGVPEEAMLGRRSTDDRWVTLRPDGSELPCDEHPVAVALSTQTPVVGVVVGVCAPAAKVRWLEIEAQPLFGVDDAFVGVATHFTDVTGRWTLEQALTRTRRQLDLVTEDGRVATFEWDVETGRVELDGTTVKVTSDPDASQGAAPWRHLLELVHPDDRERASADILLGSRGRPLVGSYRFVRSDGSEGVLEVRSHLASEAGGQRRLVGTLVDVTELSDARARMVELLESMTDAYFTVDERFRFTYMNRAAERCLARSRIDLLGKVVWVELPFIHAPEFESHYQLMLVGGRPVEFETFSEALSAWFEVRLHQVPGGAGVFFRDVSSRREAQAERERLLVAERAARVKAEHAQSALAFAALHDDLTGLPNRAALESHLRDRLRCHQRQIAVCYFDLDRFKLVNDCGGHSEGDQLLCQVAARLVNIIGPEDFVARFGGDEFVLVLDAATRAELLESARRVTEAIRDPFDVGIRRLFITSTIGLTFAQESSSVEGLLRDADAALYVGKDRGRDRVEIFTGQIRDRILARVELESDLRIALGHDDIRAHYQPIFSMTTGRPIGVEALARWHHATRGAISPGQFVPVAEDAGLVGELGSKMRRRAALDARAAAAVTQAPDLTMWVNAAPAELHQPGFASRVLGAAENHGLPIERLGIEVTEGALSTGSRHVAKALRTLSERGVSIAIDDFGTGYSSLSRIHQFPVDVVKVDRSFVARLHRPEPVAIISAVTEVAHAVGATVCAEGVESSEQLVLLAALGVDSVSGFFLAAPSPIDELAAVTAAGRSRLLPHLRRCPPPSTDFTIRGRVTEQPCDLFMVTPGATELEAVRLAAENELLAHGRKLLEDVRSGHRSSGLDGPTRRGGAFA